MILKFCRIFLLNPIATATGKIHRSVEGALLDTDTNIVQFPDGDGTGWHNVVGFEGRPVRIDVIEAKKTIEEIPASKPQRRYVTRNAS